MVEVDYSKHHAVQKLNKSICESTNEYSLIYNWVRQRVLTYKDFNILLEYLKEKERNRIFIN